MLSFNTGAIIISFFKNGAGEQIRTVDLRITSALLYLWATPASKLKFITQDIL